jgi:hypothetical protein
METKMKAVNLKKTLRVAGILSLMGTTLAMDGASEDLLNIPTGNVRSRTSVGNVEKLTFEHGQFTATINGKTRIVENHEVSKDLKTLVAINKLYEYLNAGGKLSLGNPGPYIDLHGELLGGSKFGPFIKFLKEKAVPYVWKNGKWVAKKGKNIVWDGSKWVKRPPDIYGMGLNG